MCIAAMALNAHPRWQLVVAANRDEYHARDAAPLAHWDDRPAILAGRDLKGGGTWLGVSENGRMVLVTNFRVPGYPKPERPSRGRLVTGLLDGHDPAAIDLAPFNPFNLVVANPQGAQFLSNHPEQQRSPLPSGVHGLSNGALAPAWPKTRRLCGDLSDWLAGDTHSIEPLFAALRDESPHDSAGDGPGEGPEPRLSGVFIRDPVYGTRCSTVILIDRQGSGRIAERRFDANGAVSGESVLDFRWPGQAGA